MNTELRVLAGRSPATSPRLKLRRTEPPRGSPAEQQRRVLAQRAQPPRLAWPVSAFLIALVIPWIFTVGPLSLPAPRLFLAAMVVPCLVKWLRGDAGRIRAADIALLLFCAWAVIGLVVVHGPDFALKSGGMLFVETIGGYLLARCYIRSADDFLAMAQMLFRIVALLFPFALFETVTGKNPLLVFFSAIAPSYDFSEPEVRAGFSRVQSVFDHPILFGICMGSAFALTHLVVGRGMAGVQRWWRTIVVGLTAVVSLSSAPIAALGLQAGLMAWNWLLGSVRHRWKIAWGLFFLGYLVVALGSNQGPVQFYISKLTFNPHTGWHRLLIWEYGSASVLANPLFGIGFNDWPRQAWMSPSVDMFWLLNAMRHGLPAGLLIFAAFLLLFVAISCKKGLDARTEAYRVAYLIVMVSFFVVGWTVHFWGMAYMWFLFLLGSGVWLLEVRTPDRAIAPVPRPRRPGPSSGSAQNRSEPAPAQNHN